MTTRRAMHASGKPMQTNPDMQASGSRSLAHTENEMDEEDPTQGIPEGATELGPGRLRPAFVTEYGPSELGPSELGPVLIFKG